MAARRRRKTSSLRGDVESMLLQARPTGTKVAQNPSAATRARLPGPEQAEALAMSADHCCRLDDRRFSTASCRRTAKLSKFQAANAQSSRCRRATRSRTSLFRMAERRSGRWPVSQGFCGVPGIQEGQPAERPPAPASGLCCEDSPTIVIPHELSGRTLREFARNAEQYQLQHGRNPFLRA